MLGYSSLKMYPVEDILLLRVSDFLEQAVLGILYYPVRNEIITVVPKKEMLSSHNLVMSLQFLFVRKSLTIVVGSDPVDPSHMAIVSAELIHVLQKILFPGLLLPSLCFLVSHKSRLTPALKLAGTNVFKILF